MVRSGPPQFPITWIAGCLQCKADVRCWSARPEDVHLYSGTLVFYFLFSRFGLHASYSWGISVWTDKDTEAEFRCGITPCHLNIMLYAVMAS